MSLRNILMMIACVGWASVSWAQGTEVSFGTPAPTRDQPIEVSAEQLVINQDAGTAEYLGDVIMSQGDMRLTAPRVLIIYDEAASEIDRVEASGGVTLSSATDAAEAETAVYQVRAGQVLMSGNVLLAQGLNTLASDDMVLNLDNGTAQVLGRVRTVLTQNTNKN